MSFFELVTDRVMVRKATSEAPGPSRRSRATTGTTSWPPTRTAPSSVPRPPCPTSSAAAAASWTSPRPRDSVTTGCSRPSMPPREPSSTSCAASPLWPLVGVRVGRGGVQGFEWGEPWIRAEADGAGDQGLVAADGAVGADSEVRPADGRPPGLGGFGPDGAVAARSRMRSCGLLPAVGPGLVRHSRSRQPPPAAAVAAHGEQRTDAAAPCGGCARPAGPPWLT